MRVIGLLGGMSWESSAVYYRLLNEGVRARLGGNRSADLILRSFDFQVIADLQAAGDWEAAGDMLAGAAADLERAGAGVLAIATNTMHKLVPAIRARTTLPIVHIADATAEAVRKADLSRVALLATRYTMEQDFYVGRLRDPHGLDVRVPEADERADIHRVIYEELCQGVVRPDSRRRYQDIIARLVDGGAQGVILGCTEIGLLIGPGDVAVPVFDTTALHCGAILDAALAG